MRTAFNSATTAIVRSNLDFSGFNGRNQGTFYVEFEKIDPKHDLFGTGFHIEIIGKKLSGELFAIFNLAEELKHHLKYRSIKWVEN